MTNFLIMEYPLGFEPMGFEIADPPLGVENSYIRLLTALGLGIDLKKEALDRYNYKEFPKRKMPHYLA